MLLYVHLCNVDKIKYKTIEKDFYERFSYCIYTGIFSPRFLRRYADLHEVMTGAVTSYVEDVKSGDFPNESEQY